MYGQRQSTFEAWASAPSIEKRYPCLLRCVLASFIVFQNCTICVRDTINTIEVRFVRIQTQKRFVLRIVLRL
ncbi:hypothetical protein VNO80_25270 [Phaseolus coccineus]|uniref:Uncharacterized protein n=1 Tax=Phaseolus coccineus TaxID=3886 RepID=A0AAN9LYV2_PHACN